MAGQVQPGKQLQSWWECRGAKADGRMAAVGMVWNPGVDGQVRDVCGMTGGLAALGEPLRRQAAQVGFDRADNASPA